MLHSLLISTGGVVAIVIAIIVVLLAIIVIAWWIKTRNAFVQLKNKVEEAWATIDVFLKKRFDLIPNLVATVKGYAKHESETMEKVVAARNLSAGAKTVEEKMSAANNLTSSLRTFFTAVSENYPELKADRHFLDLQSQLKNIESELESSRRYYNGVVKSFNTKLELFPANIVGKRMGAEYVKKNYFELDSEAERQNVRVEF